MSEIISHLLALPSLLHDPSVWIALATLVTLEVVLGIDNLAFIAILSERVEPRLRDRARYVGLLMALLLRLVLLSVASWLIRLETPLFSIASVSFSGRNLIFIFGGIFLLYKATIELHERLEGQPAQQKTLNSYAPFWTTVLQIMVLDAVFSLDAVVTAVSMTVHLPVMMAAVIIAIGLMMLASKPISNFVNSHPTVVVLCLSFLLMIGFSLIVEGFGLHVPKGYLYAAIGFSVLIEIFNQIALSNYKKLQLHRPLRERTAETILRLMGEKQRLSALDDDSGKKPELGPEAESIAGEESSMITGVLNLGERSLRSLMTPRPEIRWIDMYSDADYIRMQILEEQHTHYPICRESLDEILGIARASDILETLREEGHLGKFTKLRKPTMAPESMDGIRLLKLMRQSPGNIVLAVDEFGSVTGLITPVDVFEIIAGEFLDEDEKPDLSDLADGRLLAQGYADLHLLEQRLELDGLLPQDADYGSVAGLLLDKLGHFPAVGEELVFKGLKFIVQRVSPRRIEEVIIEMLPE